MKLISSLANQKLVILMDPGEVHEYLQQRRLQITGDRISAFADVLHISRPQASDVLSGRVPFGRLMMERLNAVDPAYEVRQLIGVFEKQPGEEKA